jgi:hypothetical protein
MKVQYLLNAILIFSFSCSDNSVTSLNNDAAANKVLFQVNDDKYTTITESKIITNETLDWECASYAYLFSIKNANTDKTFLDDKDERILKIGEQIRNSTFYFKYDWSDFKDGIIDIDVNDIIHVERIGESHHFIVVSNGGNYDNYNRIEFYDRNRKGNNIVRDNPILYDLNLKNVFNEDNVRMLQIYKFKRNIPSENYVYPVKGTILNMTPSNNYTTFPTRLDFSFDLENNHNVNGIHLLIDGSRKREIDPNDCVFEYDLPDQAGSFTWKIELTNGNPASGSENHLYSGTRTINIVTNTTISFGTPVNDRVKVQWNHINNADEFELYRSSNDYNYAKIATIEALSYIDVGGNSDFKTRKTGPYTTKQYRYYKVKVKNNYYTSEYTNTIRTTVWTKVYDPL